MSIVALGVFTFVDEQRETQAALADYGAEQVVVARAAAGTIRASLDESDEIEARGADVPIQPDDVLRAARTRLQALEQPGLVRVFVSVGEPRGVVDLEGVRAPGVVFERSRQLPSERGSWVRLSHEDSQALGLPPRTAIAGVADIDAVRGWKLAIVSSAQRERDREERALWRVALGFVFTSAIVVTFGTLALRRKRKELELEHRLTIAAREQASDERLVRADKLATLGALAMGIAHEVATPLGVILGRAERLAPKVVHDERASRAVAMIREQARRIDLIVRGFLRLARGGTPTLEHLEPAALVRAAIELVAHRFDKAEVTLGSAIAAVLPKIAGEPRLLEQVVVNLLLNACDACLTGGYVEVAVTSVGRSVQICVQDDGEGIPADAIARSIEPFFTTKSPEHGTGLGLTIVREIVAHHHGTLSLEPAPKRGTVARILIPALEEREGDA